jgi:hypothetical protein
MSHTCASRGRRDPIGTLLGAALENFEISVKYIYSELNVVDMVCWINIHQGKSKQKSWHHFHNGPKYVFSVLLAKRPN